MVIIDYNPDTKFWAKDLINSFNFINLTFLDNEYLSLKEKGNILAYRNKGYKLEANGEHSLDSNKNPIVINQYWANMWRVYGLGEVGQVEGRIYNWGKIPYSDFLKIQKQEYYYCDWGKVDPWAIGCIKYHDGNLYVDELNYSSENEIERSMSPEMLKSIKSGDSEEFEGLIPWMFKKLNVPKDAPIICDTNRPNKIRTLRRAGWEYAVGVGGKMDLINRIAALSGMNIYYTDRSTNIEMEQENYCYDKDSAGTILEKPIDQYNHHCDGLSYGVTHLFNEGVIKSL